MFDPPPAQHHDAGDAEGQQGVVEAEPGQRRIERAALAGLHLGHLSRLVQVPLPGHPGQDDDGETVEVVGDEGERGMLITCRLHRLVPWSRGRLRTLEAPQTQVRSL